MPRYIRDFVPGGTYFFTVTLADRRSELLVREVGRLRQAYGAVRRRHPFDTLAICVLPDHLHALWRLPVDDGRVSMRWSLIKHAFSSGLEAQSGRSPSLLARREKGLWQRRFWDHRIRDDDDLALHVNYIHFNPVKHGLVREVGDWPFSSVHRWMRRGDLPPSWAHVAAAGGGGFGERGGGAQAELAHPTGRPSV